MTTEWPKSKNIPLLFSGCRKLLVRLHLAPI